MTADVPSLARVAVIVPALNEADNLRRLLPELNDLAIGRIIVGDNGSTDATADVARQHGALVAHAPQRGYGAACHAALQLLDSDIEIVVFVNADLTDDLTLIPALVQPIIRDQCDLVIGARLPHLREPGSMSLPQRFGDRLAVCLIRWCWGYRYHDLGPFRAVRRTSLERLDMQDRAFGWTIEMQIRALQENLRIQQLPVPYRKSPTPNRIGGTIPGVTRAAVSILSTWWRLWRKGA